MAATSILGHLADPLIYMLGLGLGLGSLLPQLGGTSYLVFLAAGTVCGEGFKLGIQPVKDHLAIAQMRHLHHFGRIIGRPAIGISNRGDRSPQLGFDPVLAVL